MTARTPARKRHILGLCLAAAILPACTGGRVAGLGDRPTNLPDQRASAFEPGAYPQVFDAARDTLAEYRFTLDRVDAARGVITTTPKQTAGLATPWDREQSNTGDEFADLVHQHERTARIIFEPPEAPTGVRVEVVVDRVRRPNWRIETDAIRYSTFAEDPQAIRAGQRSEFRDAFREDRALADRLLARIVERTGLSASRD